MFATPAPTRAQHRPAMRPLLALSLLAAVAGATACSSTAATPAPAPTPASAVAPAAPAGETTIVAAAWMGNKTRKLYYLAGCPAAKLIPPADTVSFRTAIDAKAAGFTRAIVPDC